MLITFSGIDCSGKSTQIELIKSHYNHSNRSVVTLWARGGYTPIFVFFKYILRILFVSQLPSQGNSLSRTKSLSNPFIAKLWLSIAILDLILFWGIYLRWNLLMNRIVICDRYIDDTRLDFRINFPQISFEKSSLWLLLERVVPKPNKSFLLLIPVQESLTRSLQKSEPYPDTEFHLNIRFDFYSSLPSISPLPYVFLDGRLSISSIFDLVLFSLQKF